MFPGIPGARTMTDDAELHRRATRRADMKLGFRSHLLVYAVVNAALAAINLITSPGYLWFVWPLGGWGLGVAAHAAAVYFDGEHVRERMIKDEYEKLRRRATGLR
jgi:uncharacterized membrane protein YdbT with pleckstrin-like domain